MKKNRFTKVLAKTLLASALAVTFMPMNQVHAEELSIKANYEEAINSIEIPRYEADGSYKQQKVSKYLKAHLDTKDLTAIKDDVEKTLTVDLQIKDVYLASDYLNGVSLAGRSYYNMLNYYTSILQIDQLLKQNQGYTVIDKNGDNIDADYISQLLDLLNQINAMDPKTNLVYDVNSAYDTQAFQNNPAIGGTDVIATSNDNPNVKIKFHIDSHGYWGYDLGAHDSITGTVMGYDDKTAFDKQRELTTKYANFFTIKMPNVTTAKCYMLNATDLENPMIYVSNDGKEALMIDVDMYGENVINKIIKEVIGPNCESLKIFCTHMHPDHVNNLAKIYEDQKLRSITTVIWPKNEPHTVLNGKDLTTLFGEVQYVEDMEKFSAAGTQFQFIEIPDEHTKGGGQLADLNNKINYVGDTLGAQVHLGGTNVTLSSIDYWISGAQKTEKYTKDNGIKYFIGGHTPYLNNPAFATWVKTACEYAKEQYLADASWKGGLVIVEKGKVVSGERLGEIFAKGLSDREELDIASINFRNDLAPNEYKITEGSSQEIKQGEEITFKTDVDFSKFQKVLIDGKEVDVKNYTAQSGSTMITLHKDYTDTLKTGQHTITLIFTDGEATAEFNILENKEVVVPPETPTQPESTSPVQPKPSQPVVTDDNSQVVLYTLTGTMAMLAIAAYVYKKYYSHNKS
ncbi:MBL fold metallo-hydrolase [Candidatus Stoquefichus massiliensis]|uniref:MBL fold metallo-hydrolase n=1 Tax=Candidatus Stoquefichus massiliensis TaxID=1470350 RepID=UPI000486334E|nr:MBL fold metallo-hydrolase [Candidatus Stoquefichus massiliensis]